LPAARIETGHGVRACTSRRRYVSSASYNRILWQIRQNQNMKSSLPIFALLACLPVCAVAIAQVPPPESAADPTHPASAGEVLVDRVIAAASAQTSISAKLRHRVELLGRPILGTGLYLQQGRGAATSFRLEAEFRTKLFPRRQWQISDGTRLWIVDELDGAKNLTMVDVARLHRAQPKSPGTAPPPGLSALGGLGRLLENLQAAFVFHDVVESRLDDLAVLSIEGAWTRPRLIQLLPDQKATIESGGPVDLMPLAPNLPHRVVLHVGCDDLFPYRIEYWRSVRDKDEPQDTGREQLLLVMEMYEVQLGAQIDPANFAFQPGKEITPIDRTEEFMNRLGLQDPPPSEARRRLRSPL
jgi:hypothetical protein